MDAIEEVLQAGDFREIILSTPPHTISSLLHADLPHRVAHLGLPVTTVAARARLRPVAGHRPQLGEA